MIYFIRCEQNTSNIRVGNIKVGTTKRLSQRLPQIANDLGHMPKVLGVMDGSFAEERALHEKFADYRSTGEWFEPSMHMAGLIDAEARPWDGVDEVPLVDESVSISIKTTVAFRDWVTEVAQSERITVVQLIEKLLADHGKQAGFKTAPRRTVR